MGPTTQDSSSSSAVAAATKFSDLYDHPSSTTRPLLYPQIQTDPSQSDLDSDAQTITYNNSRRPFKDLPYLLIFFLLFLSTYSLGIFATVNRNPDSQLLNSFSYDSSTGSCIIPTSISRSISFSPNLFSQKSDLFSFLIWVLVITLILSLPLTFLVLLLLRRYAKQVVYACVPLFVVVPVCLNIYWFVACSFDASCSVSFPLVYRVLVSVFVFLVIGVVVWILVSNWGRVRLTVSIVGVAANALSRNLGLLGVLPGLSVGLVVCFVPVLVFLAFATRNGRIVPKEKHGEWYCFFDQDGWVSAYYGLAIVTMVWSLAVMVEAQVYVISGTIAQWYFAKDDSSLKRSLRTSLRNAFGPSSGTICLSGMLLFVVRLVRAVVDNAKEDAPGIVNLILRCCVNAFMAAFEFLNKFTINFAAITGESYCTSARMVYELLSRNLLSAVFVETVSTRILGGIIFVLSAIYGIVVCVILKGACSLGNGSYFVAVMAFVLLMVVLSYFVHVLDNVIDTVYICYAIDRDRGDVSKQEVHDVYVHLPVSRNHRSHVVRTPIVV